MYFCTHLLHSFIISAFPKLVSLLRLIYSSSYITGSYRFILVAIQFPCLGFLCVVIFRSSCEQFSFFFVVRNINVVFFSFHFCFLHYIFPVFLFVLLLVYFVIIISHFLLFFSCSYLH